MASELANLYLTYYLQYSDAQDGAKHISEGKRDGGNETPLSPATELGHYEQSILSRATTDTQQYKSAHDQGLGTLNRQVDSTEEEFEANKALRRTALTRDQQTETQLLAKECGNASPKHQHLTTSLQDSSAGVRRIKLEVGQRPLHAHFAALYSPLLIVLTILEVPINQQAFAFFFDHQPAIAYLIALAVGIFFIFFAHMTGWMLRTTGSAPGQNSPPQPYFVVTGLVTFVLVCMYFLASVRNTYLQFISGTGSDEALLGSLGLIEVASTAASKWAEVFSSPEALMFLVLNLAIFLVGGFLSFYRHDPHPDYEKLVTTNEKAVENLSILQETFTKKSVEIIEKYRGKTATLDQKLQGDLDHLNGLKSNIESSRIEFKNEVKLVREVVFQEMTAYQKGNSEVRTTTDPQYFGHATRAIIVNSITTDLS